MKPTLTQLVAMRPVRMLAETVTHTIEIEVSRSADRGPQLPQVGTATSPKTTVQPTRWQGIVARRAATLEGIAALFRCPLSGDVAGFAKIKPPPPPRKPRRIWGSELDDRFMAAIPCPPKPLFAAHGPIPCCETWQDTAAQHGIDLVHVRAVSRERLACLTARSNPSHWRTGWSRYFGLDKDPYADLAWGVQSRGLASEYPELLGDVDGEHGIRLWELCVSGPPELPTLAECCESVLAEILAAKPSESTSFDFGFIDDSFV